MRALELLEQFEGTSQPFASGTAEELFAGCETVFVRLKPYDPAAGQLVQRASVPEITRPRATKRPRWDADAGQFVQVESVTSLPRPIQGGTGLPGDIPEWIEVPRSVGIAVLSHRQSGDNPRAPALFDVVTPTERQAIDEAEQRARERVLAGQDPALVRMSTAAKASRLPGMKGGDTGPAVREAPSLLRGAEAHLQGPSVDTSPAARARRQALLQEPPPPPAATLEDSGEAGVEPPRGRNNPEDLSARVMNGTAPDVSEDIQRAEASKGSRASRARRQALVEDTDEESGDPIVSRGRMDVDD